MYYRQPPEKPPPWWLEAWALTRAVFGVLFWPMVALVGGLAVLIGTFYLFTVHWAFGLLALAAIIAGIAVYAQWERKHIGPRLP